MIYFLQKMDKLFQAMKQSILIDNSIISHGALMFSSVPPIAQLTFVFMVFSFYYSHYLI